MEIARIPFRRIGLRLSEGIDGPLFVLTLMLSLLGLATLFSASYENPGRVVNQAVNLGVAFAAMWLVAQVPPQTLMRFAVPAYAIGLALLVAVAVGGRGGDRARRLLHGRVAPLPPSRP